MEVLEGLCEVCDVFDGEFVFVDDVSEVFEGFKIGVIWARESGCDMSAYSWSCAGVAPDVWVLDDVDGRGVPIGMRPTAIVTKP